MNAATARVFSTPTAPISAPQPAGQPLPPARDGESDEVAIDYANASMVAAALGMGIYIETFI
jgi:hypothetical protein